MEINEGRDLGFRKRTGVAVFSCEKISSSGPKANPGGPGVGESGMDEYSPYLRAGNDV